MSATRSAQSGLAAIASTLVLVACASTRSVVQQAVTDLNPYAVQEVRVTATEVRGPYLIADLLGDQFDLRLIAPDRAVCRSVLEPGAVVDYEKAGVFGRASRDGRACDFTGVASLAAWRDQFPRARGRGLPRSIARYRVIYRDPDIVLARGRFPLTPRIFIPVSFDLVAIVPNSETCQSQLDRGEAWLEFSNTRRSAFRLIGAKGECPVLGFAMPAVDDGALSSRS